MASSKIDKPPAPNDAGSDKRGGGQTARNLVVGALGLLGGAFLLRKLAKGSSHWDHTRIIAEALSGEKFSTDQATEDPQSYFNLRFHACPAVELVDGSRILYVEQAFLRTPEKPYRQRFFKVKPCSKEAKCDAEVSAFAVRDVEEYRNFCDRPKNQRPQAEEVIGDIAEHLYTVRLSRCEQGESCLYKGSTPPEGFPNSWNGASICTSDLAVYKSGEIQSWDRGYNEEGAQVWGLEKGPYKFKPAA